MTAMANDVLSRRNMSDLTLFGDRGQKLFSTSFMPLPSNKSIENENLIVMSVDQTYENEKDMNCLDILAGVVSRCSSSEVEQKPLQCTIIGGGLAEMCRTAADRSDPANPQEHRVSCHRCGNIRKRKIVCERPQCPHIFCGRCADKMKNEHGPDAFLRGCPVCQELCCCVNKTVYCNRKNHCYRKCPASKCADPVAKPNTPLWDYDASGMAKQHGDSLSLEPSRSVSRQNSTGDEEFGGSNDRSDFYYMPLNKICLSKHGSLDFLAAAVSIMDRNDSLNPQAEECNPAFHQDLRVTMHPEQQQQTDPARKRLREGDRPRDCATDISTSWTATSASFTDEVRVPSYIPKNSKIVRTGSQPTVMECVPAPTYFIAENLLPPNRRNRKEQDGWKVDQPLPLSWDRRDDLQIVTGSVHNNNSNFISNNSSPISRMGEISARGRINHQDYTGRGQSGLQSDPNQVAGNMTEEESITRKLISGSRDHEYFPLLMRSNSTGSMPNYPQQHPHPHSKLGFFNPIGSLSSQLLPPPL